MKKKLSFLLVFLMVMFLHGNVVSAASTLNCKYVFSYGSTGTDVEILQQELNKVVGCNLEVDGIFGPITRSCVKTFQSKYRLEVDGVVGSKTCSKLNSLYASKKQSTTSTSIVVLAEKLNVRAGASKSSSVKGVVTRGTVLQKYGARTVNGTTWYKVLLGTSNSKKIYGYVAREYVEDTAIILDIQNQRLTFYKNGVVFMNVPVITGMEGSHDTPVGRYILKESDKQRGVTLTGKNDDGSTYHAYVEYWMPFINDRGIGFHDASWRSDDVYTTDTYHYNGSHGCVNMLESDAAKLYQNIQEDIDVLVI